VKGVDAAGPAEVVVHHPIAEQVHLERVLALEQLDVLGRDVGARHHGSSPDADGAVAPDPAGDLLAPEPEPDRAAVTLPLVGPDHASNSRAVVVPAA
jgi:hypothetical protein